MTGLDATGRRRRIKHYREIVRGWQATLKELTGEAAAELLRDIQDLESWANWLQGINESQLPRDRPKRRAG
jgi:hypothetical protein